MTESQHTNAGLRIAGTAFLHCSLAHFILRLAGSAAHLDSAATLLAAHRPAAPNCPALCRKELKKEGVHFEKSSKGTKLQQFETLLLPLCKA